MPVKNPRKNFPPRPGAATRQPVNGEGYARLRAGHPWLYEDQLEPTLANSLTEPAVVALGEHWFFYSPASKLRMRRLGPAARYWPSGDPGRSRAPVTTLVDFRLQFSQALRELFDASLRSRLRHAPEGSECFRWIFAESDFLPGLLVEAYGTTLVAQIQSAPVEKFWPVLRELLVASYAAGKGIDGDAVRVVEQRHLPVRELEGLPVEEAPGPVAPEIVVWNGFRWHMSPGGPQKTGSYLDQAANHRRAGDYAQRLGAAEAWDLCSFEGGFSLHLLRAGCKVLAVDQSERALATLAENVALNALPAEKLETRHADIFEFLKDAHGQGMKADLIVLDPPSFVKKAKDMERAMRAYHELNLRALHCVRPGGILITCACSHPVRPDDFQAMLRSAAHDARRAVRILERCGPSEDHAPLLGFAESEYLQAWYLECVL